MFDLQDPAGTKLVTDAPEARLKLDDAAPSPDDAQHELDGPEARQRYDQLMSFYRQELSHQSDNRLQQAIDEDYYDNIQWTADDAAEVKARGQAPIVYNVMAQSINWIIGSEKRGRTDFKILPRGKEDAKPAESKTKYMKYLSDVNRTPFHRSRGFEDAVKVGIGWIECGVQDEDDGEPIYDRYENWRNMLFDSASTEIDGSDMRYQFRSRWVDEDIALALFPDRADAVRRGVTNIGIFGQSSLMDGDEAMDFAEDDRELSGSVMATVTTTRRRRLRLIEASYRLPMPVKKLRGGAFNGQPYDDKDPRHAEAVQAGYSVVIEKTMMRTRCAIMTVSDLLYDAESIYRHNRHKFIPIWGYRRGRDGLPYGVIRGLRDIQDDINKRASKALHILSANKVIMEENVLPEGMDIEEFAEEYARPDSINVVRSGALAGGKIRTDVDRELAPAHLDLMSRNIQMIQQVGGVTDELLGRTTNAVSGVAVEKRQEQGSLATSKLFDNLRLAVQMHGEIELSLVEQFVTEQKEFRITNQRGTPEFVTMNDGLPENDITRTKADFVISEADWRATMRQAATAQLTEMLTKMPPQVAMVVLDLVVESMDIENRDEIVKRIRQVTGMRDPDATEPTPEEQQAAAQKAKEAAAQEAMFAAELGIKQADAMKKGAEADKAKASIALTQAQTVAQNMMGAQEAMTAATAVITMPTIAKVADQLLKEGGWQGGQPIAMPPPGSMPAQGMPPQAVPPAAAQQGMTPPAAELPPQTGA